jgi:protein SCO1/2
MRTLVAGAVVLTLAVAARAEAPLPVPLQGVDFEQRLDAQVPLDATFRDEAGREVRLGDYFTNKPVILVLAYFRCPMLCTEVLNGLVRTMLDLPQTPGKEFEVITVSFDPHDTPDMAARKKATYLERFGRPGADRGWHFLTGDEPSIRRVTDAVGFHYTYDPANDQFNHASGILVLTPGGKVSRYFYDVRYSPRDLRLALVEASDGRIGSQADRVLLYCFHYDPAVGRYGPAVINLVRAGGVLTVVLIGVMVVGLRRLERRARAGGEPCSPK